MDQLLACLEFVAALLLIAGAGGRLSRYGELIGERTGLGGSWIGLVLLAPVTSMPELITGLGAVGLTGSIDIAVGAILGSCLFNLLIIALLDFLLGAESVFARVQKSHLRAAGCSVLLAAVALLGLLLERDTSRFGTGPMGHSTLLILVAYLFSIRSIYHRDRLASRVADPEPRVALPALDDAGLGLRFSAFAAVVVAAGLWLPFAGVRLATAFGIHESFIGTLFVACATSVPEMVVAVAALRIGAPNMAFSNLLGSNLFNLVILVPEDLLYSQGPILAAASPLHAVSATCTVIMTVITMVSLGSRPRVQLLRFGPASVVLIAVYLVNSYLGFRYAG
jgi:cation:H+ antiporter